MNGSGIATLSTSSLIDGQNSISAEYSGDPNFLPSSSVPPLQVLVATPDFDFTVAPAELILARGESRAVELAAHSIVGLTTTLISSCSGLPTRASCHLEDEPQIALAPNGASAHLVIQAFSPRKTSAMNSLGGVQASFCGAGILLCALGGRRRQSRLILRLCVLLVAGAWSSGCGVDPNELYPVPGTYAVRVTLTNTSAHSMSHSEMLKVTIR
jgi:hypothetical protein